MLKCVIFKHGVEEVSLDRGGGDHSGRFQRESDIKEIQKQCKARIRGAAVPTDRYMLEQLAGALAFISCII